MAKIKTSILLLGEGPTEFFYFNSLRPVLGGVTIKPDYPKHTNMSELEAKIADGIHKGYDYILCAIDMDTKDSGIERVRYLRLKQKYGKIVSRPESGIRCEVRFYETHHCTELFFLYYFCYASKMYKNQESLIKELRRRCEYEKTCEFFMKSKGLHSYFEKNGGSLETAITNAERSCKERLATGRDYTYSELGRMMLDLQKWSKKPNL